METSRDVRYQVHRKGVWIVIAFGIVIVTAMAIADSKRIYFGLIAVPPLLLLGIVRPFIFPLGAYIFLVPFDSVISLTGSAGGATATKMLGILTILFLTLKGLYERKLKWPGGAAIIWVLFVGFGLLSVSWAIEPSYVIGRLPTALGLLLLYLVGSAYRAKESEFNACTWFLLLGGLMAALYAIHSYREGLFYGATVRGTLALEGQNTDPNLFAFSLIIPVAVCISHIIKQERKALKVILSVAMGIMLFGIIITGSRGGMLGIGAVVITYILSLRREITVWMLLAVIGVAILALTPVFVIERWEEAVETGGTGRLGIWTAGLKYLETNWIYGAGLNNFPNAYHESAWLTPVSEHSHRAAHNSYLSTAVELGIVGLFLLIVVILKHYKIMRPIKGRSDVSKIMLKASFWGTLVASTFLDTIWTKQFWLLWMLIMMHRNVVEFRVREYPHFPRVLSSWRFDSTPPVAMENPETVRRRIVTSSDMKHRPARHMQ